MNGLCHVSREFVGTSCWRHAVVTGRQQTRNDMTDDFEAEEPTFWIKPDRRQKADRRSSGIGGRRATDSLRVPTGELLSPTSENLAVERAAWRADVAG
jgi:hypothetical protein